MKKSVILWTICACHLNGQTLHRIFPQPPATQSFYLKGDINPIIKTSDNGYLVSANPWTSNLHSAYPVDHMTIKTNSSLVPLWKKNVFVKSRRLPTGGIICINQSINSQIYTNSTNQLTKMDNAGQAIWTKSITVNIQNHYTELLDMTVFGNKIIAVGADYYNDPMYINSTQKAHLVEMDTSGAVQNIYMAMGTSSVGPTPAAIFDKIIRLASGDYLIGDQRNYGICRISGTYNTMFSMKQASKKLRLIDAFELANQELLCLLQSDGAYQGDTNSVLLRLGPTGSFISAKEIPLHAVYGGMEKTASGKYIITGVTYPKNSNDTAKNFVMMIDSNGVFQWGRKQRPSIGASKPLCEGTKVTYAYYGFYTQPQHLALISGDDTGNFPCANTPITLTLNPTFLSFASLPITLVQTTMTQTTGATYSNTTQTYADSCYLSPIITGVPELNNHRTKLWPNPTNGVIHVSVTSDQKTEVEILSLSGRLLLLKPAGEIDLNGLDPGIYILRVRSGDTITAYHRVVLLE